MVKTIVAVILQGYQAIELTFTTLPLPVQSMIVHWRRTKHRNSLILSLDVKHLSDEEIYSLLEG